MAIAQTHSKEEILDLVFRNEDKDVAERKQIAAKEEILDLVFRNEDKDAAERKQVAAPTEKASPTTWKLLLDGNFLKERQAEWVAAQEAKKP